MPGGRAPLRNSSHFSSGSSSAVVLTLACLLATSAALCGPGTGDDGVSIEVPVPQGVTECTVSWRSWAAGERDPGEYDTVMVDDVTRWQAEWVLMGNGRVDFENYLDPTRELGTDLETVCGTQLRPAQPWYREASIWAPSNSRVCFVDASVRVACSGTIRLSFHSGVDEPIDDEAWAFSNVEIVGYPGALTVLHDEPVEHEWAGWSDTTATAVPGDCPACVHEMVHGPWGNRGSVDLPCRICPMGRFSPSTSTRACIQCPAGSVTRSTGATECVYDAACAASCRIDNPTVPACMDHDSGPSWSALVAGIMAAGWPPPGPRSCYEVASNLYYNLCNDEYIQASCPLSCGLCTPKMRSEIFLGSCTYHELETLEQERSHSEQCMHVSDVETCRYHCDKDLACTSYKFGDSIALETTGVNCCLDNCAPTSSFVMDPAKACHVCEDDPNFELSLLGLTCDTYLRMMTPPGTELGDCDTASPYFGWDTVPWMHWLCPASCNACIPCDDEPDVCIAGAEDRDQPATSPTPPSPCNDDPNGSLGAYGGCAAIVAYGCDTDLHTLNPATPVGTLVSVLCPVSCDACPPQEQEQESPSVSLSCEDDPNGSLDAYGGCAAIVAYGCDTDLHTLNPATPVGTLVSVLCPVSCDACPPQEQEQQPAQPPINSPTAQGSWRMWVQDDCVGERTSCHGAEDPPPCTVATSGCNDRISWCHGRVVLENFSGSEADISMLLGVSPHRIVQNSDHSLAILPDDDGSNLSYDVARVLLMGATLSAEIVHWPRCEDQDLPALSNLPTCTELLDGEFHCAADMSLVSLSLHGIVTDYCPATCGVCGASWMHSRVRQCEACPHSGECGFTGGHCRLLHISSLAGWAEADAECEAAGGHLASMYDETVYMMSSTIIDTADEPSDCGDDTCRWSRDGECDEEFNACPVDTDCSDCQSKGIGACCSNDWTWIGYHRTSKHEPFEWSALLMDASEPLNWNCDSNQCQQCDDNGQCWTDHACCPSDPDSISNWQCAEGYMLSFQIVDSECFGANGVGNVCCKRTVSPRAGLATPRHNQRDADVAFSICPDGYHKCLHDSGEIVCDTDTDGVCDNVCAITDRMMQGLCTIDAVVPEMNCAAVRKVAGLAEIEFAFVPCEATLPFVCEVCTSPSDGASKTCAEPFHESPLDLADASCRDDARNFLRFWTGGPYRQIDDGWLGQSNIVEPVDRSPSELCAEALALRGVSCLLDLSKIWFQSAPAGLYMHLLCPETCAMSEPDTMCYVEGRCSPHSDSELGECVEKWDRYGGDLSRATNPMVWISETMDHFESERCVDDDDMLPESWTCAALAMTCTCDTTVGAAEVCCRSCPGGANPLNPRCACRDKDAWTSYPSVSRVAKDLVGSTRCTAAASAGWCAENSTVYQALLAEGEDLRYHCCKSCSADANACPSRDETSSELALQLAIDVGVDAAEHIRQLFLGGHELSCHAFDEHGLCGETLHTLYSNQRQSVAFGPALRPLQDACPSEAADCWSTRGCQDHLRDLLVGDTAPADCEDVSLELCGSAIATLVQAVRDRNTQEVLCHGPNAECPNPRCSNSEECRGRGECTQVSGLSDDNIICYERECLVSIPVSDGVARWVVCPPRDRSLPLPLVVLEQLCPASLGTCRRKGTCFDDQWGFQLWGIDMSSAMGVAFEVDVAESCSQFPAFACNQTGRQAMNIDDEFYVKSLCPARCGMCVGCDDGSMIGADGQCTAMGAVASNAAKLLGCAARHHVIGWHPWQGSRAEGQPILDSTEQGFWVYHGHAGLRPEYPGERFPAAPAVSPSEYPCRRNCTACELGPACVSRLTNPLETWSADDARNWILDDVDMGSLPLVTAFLSSAIDGRALGFLDPNQLLSSLTVLDRMDISLRDRKPLLELVERYASPAAQGRPPSIRSCSRLRGDQDEREYLVHQSVTVTDLFAVDDIAMEFEVAMRVETTWADDRVAYLPDNTEAELEVCQQRCLDPTLADDSRTHIELLRCCSRLWVPQITFTNMKELKVIQEPLTYWRDDKATMQTAVRGTFKVTMKFDSFPFDRQALAVRMKLTSFSNDVQLRRGLFEVQDPDNGCPGWTIVNQVSSQSTEKPDEVTVQFQVERVADHFIDNYLSSIVMLTTLSWTSFALKDTYIEARLAATITLVLALMALSQVITPSLPVVSTPGHRFMSHSNVFIMMAGIESIIVYGLGIDNHIVTQRIRRQRRRGARQRLSETIARGDGNHDDSDNQRKNSRSKSFYSTEGLAGSHTIEVNSRKARMYVHEHPELTGELTDSQRKPPQGDITRDTTSQPSTPRRANEALTAGVFCACRCQQCVVVRVATNSVCDGLVGLDIGTIIDLSCTICFPAAYVYLIRQCFPQIPGQGSYFVVVLPIVFPAVLILAQLAILSESLYRLPCLRHFVPNLERHTATKYDSENENSGESDALQLLDVDRSATSRVKDNDVDYAASINQPTEFTEPSDVDSEEMLPALGEERAQHGDVGARGGEVNLVSQRVASHIGV